MKAMIPDGRRLVQMADVPEPNPRPSEAVVEVHAYSINWGETRLLKDPPAGWRPGKDISGTVIVEAADGTGPAVGTRVVGHPPASGWSERVAVPTSSLVPLPDAVDAVVAAALPLAGLTALRLLRVAGYPAGQRLLITGASGGVGHYFTELAVAAGADVTAVSSTPERGARLRELGAHTVTDVEHVDGWFDVAMDSIGGSVLGAVRRRVRPDGLVIWFGQAGGEPVTLNFFDWVRSTVGATVTQFDYQRTDGAKHSDGDDLATLVRLVTEGRLHPEIETVLPWDHTAAAIEDLRSRRLRGNAVLRVA